MSNNGEKVHEFYSNDIVFRYDKHKRITLGVVTDSYEVSSDIDDYHALHKGQIRVIWNNNTSREQVWLQSRVKLLNRNIIPGDVVRRMDNGKETQRGYCKESKEVVAVQIVGTDKVIEHVSGDRLRNVKRYSVDDAICIGDKFGRIENIEECIRMQSSDGSVVEVLTSLNSDLDDYWLYKRNKLSFGVHYPGQEIICTPANLNQPNWIKKTKIMKKSMHQKKRFTVQTVKEDLVEVVWHNNSSYSNFATLLPEEIKEIKVLAHPYDKILELTERRLLKIGANDVLIKKKDWMRKLWLQYRSDVPKVRHIVNSKNKNRVPLIRSPSIPYSCPDEEPEEDWWTEEGEEFDEDGSTSLNSPITKRQHYPPKPKELAAGYTLPVEVIFIDSKVTVVWQDGHEEQDIPSTQLYYSLSLDDHEFFPGEWVIYDNTKGAKENNAQEYGVIQYVNYSERTAKVKWFEYLENSEKPKELSVKEISVYDIKKHPKFVFRPGSIVKSKPAQESKMGRVIDSSIHGYVIVKWLGNLEENCWPQKIEVMPDTNDYDYSDSDDCLDDDDTQVSWDTESIESYVGDTTDETSLQNMAARLDFVRSRIIYLKDALQNHTVAENFSFLKDLLLVYDNSSYLDKLLGTSFFSLKSRHFQTLLHLAKEKAKTLGVEMRGRLFCNDNLCPSVTKLKNAEKENINKIIKLENKINAQIEKCDSGNKEIEATSPKIPDIDLISLQQDNICVELLSMIKIRMDLAYAEIISRIGGTQALSVITKASENIVSHAPTPLPTFPNTPDDSFSNLTNSSPLKAALSAQMPIEGNQSNGDLNMIEDKPEKHCETGYCLLEEAPTSHHFYKSKFQPSDYQKFLKAVQKEFKLLKESLPTGVWVRAYSNRLDLLSVMIRGPAKTPYEDGLFLFDIQLSADYPRSPPIVHYISYSSERLNPNLYVEGKVCISLLGTWMGRGTEVWGQNSTLLQLIVSIQGLILVSEPYYNEAGYEKQTNTMQGYENSRTYNELVILKLVQSMGELIQSPPDVFKQEILNHFKMNGNDMCDRLENYCREENPVKPEFLLLPVSKGLKLSLASALSAFRRMLKDLCDK